MVMLCVSGDLHGLISIFKNVSDFYLLNIYCKSAVTAVALG